MLRVDTLSRSERPRRLHALPMTLALAMLAIVVLAGLLPDTGAVTAASNCSYGKCPSSTSFPLWAVSAAVLVAVLAIILALLLLRRRGRQPPETETPAGTDGAAGATWQEGQPPAQEWSENPPAQDGSGGTASGDAPADESSS